VDEGGAHPDSIPTGSASRSSQLTAAEPIAETVPAAMRVTARARKRTTTSPTSEFSRRLMPSTPSEASSSRMTLDPHQSEVSVSDLGLPDHFSGSDVLERTRESLELEWNRAQDRGTGRLFIVNDVDDEQFPPVPANFQYLEKNYD
jgi:hypothetical protein